MLRHRDILQGAHFVWLTDHKALTFLLQQRDLPERLARWFVTISEFDFEVQYIAGAENILPDALSRMYAFDAPGTERSPSEHAEFDTDINDSDKAPSLVTMPLLVGAEALASVVRKSSRVPGASVRRRVEQPAETGRPETAKEFARRVKDRFVLPGARRTKEGGKGR